MQEFRVFYAWQSDRPGNHCKHLIRDAADIVADRVSDDAGVPFQIVIDQDTQDVPGLCDIPATILDKFDKCDAFLADLTYIGTSGEDGSEAARYCPNPNVLFELGYAFREVGSDRIILVMNERYGPVKEQIFDLDHRRHPISYTFPADAVTHGQAVEHLSKLLEPAIRMMLGLGSRGASKDDAERVRNEEVQARLQDLGAFESSIQSRFFTVCCYPTQSVHDRWPNLASLEGVIRSRNARSEVGDEFPPFTKGNERREWGIANNLYGEPWLLTRSGIFLFSVAMELGGGDYSQHTQHTQERSPTFRAGTWVSLEACRERIFSSLQFCEQFSQEFAADEEIEVSISAPIEGLHLMLSGPMRSLFLQHLEPSRAKQFLFSRQLKARELQDVWIDLTVEAIDRFVELFPPPLGRESGSSREWVEEKANRLGKRS